MSVSVTSNADTNTVGTLRYALLSTTANVITIASNVSLIILESPIAIDRNVTIFGNNVTITYTNTFADSQIFSYTPNVSVSFYDVNFLGNLTNPGNVRIIGTFATPMTFLTMVTCTCSNWRMGPFVLVTASNGNLSFNNVLFQNNNGSALVGSNRSELATGVFTINMENCRMVNNTLTNTCFLLNTTGAPDQEVSVVLKNTVIQNNDMSGGSIIGIENANRVVNQLIVEDVDIISNTGTSSNLGIYTTGSTIASVDINRVKIEGNVNTGVSPATVGLSLNSTAAGISATTNISNVSIRNNTSGNRVGIQTELNTSASLSNTVSISNSVVINNTTPSTVVAGIVNLGGTNAIYSLSNVMVAGNSSGVVGGIRLFSGNAKVFRNVTIADNVGTTIGGLQIVAGSLTMYNTLIAGNWQDASRTISADALGAVNSASNYNLVGNASTLVGLTLPENITGTDIAPVDAVLGAIGNYGGANNFYVIPLLEGSPAINAGDNAQAAPFEFDVRGDPLVRIYNGTVDIGAFEWQAFIAPCFLGDSQVKVQIIDTNEQTIIRADQVKADKHLLHNVLTNEYVPIKYVAKIEGVESAYLIQSDLLGENKPFADLTITAGHPVLYDGKPVKAKDVPGAIKVDFKRTNVYSFVCDKWQPVDVNGIGVYAWSEKKWLNHVKEACVVYSKC